jgi:phospholipase C
MIVISPWTRGGWVNSQVFDHTSVLRFLEKRFGVAEPNISPWRRTVCGDLSSIFDFDVSHADRLDTRWVQALPSVAGYIAETEALCKSAAPPKIATATDVTAQEPGTRPARPLPYRFAIKPVWSAAGLTLGFVNNGPVGIVFGVQDEIAFPGWRYFTVAAGSRLEEAWSLHRDRRYALVVRGPNGFQREFRGDGGTAQVEAAITWREDGVGGTLHLAHRGTAAASVTLHCAHSDRQEHFVLAGETQHPVTLPDHRWYDLQLTTADGARLRLAGHVETGQPGVSELVAAYPHPV